MLYVYIVVIISVWFVDYERQAAEIQTVVDKVFGGKTLSTVVCRDCLDVSSQYIIYVATMSYNYI